MRRDGGRMDGWLSSRLVWERVRERARVPFVRN